MRARDKTHRPIYMTAAMVITVLLAVTVLLVQDNPEEVILTEEEFPLLLASAEKGDARAQFNLGVMYANGRGVLRDDAEGVRWYRLAADQGNAFAQFNLGNRYANGRGVLKNSLLAHMWSNIAGANGNARARKLRDSLERDMTRAEISRATELAQECMASDYQDCAP